MGQGNTPDESGSGSSNAAMGRMGMGGGTIGGHGGYASGHGGTVLYDAVYLGSNEVMAKQKGRKALVILSDGDDRGSQETLAKSIEAAQRADTVVYAIYFKGEEHGGFGNHGGPGQGGGFPGGGTRRARGLGGVAIKVGEDIRVAGGRHDDQVDGKKVLQRMCDETGGRLFRGEGQADGGGDLCADWGRAAVAVSAGIQPGRGERGRGVSQGGCHGAVAAEGFRAGSGRLLRQVSAWAGQGVGLGSDEPRHYTRMKSCP